MDAALAHLKLQGICVLNYLDDWLILAHSRELVSYHRDIILCHIRALGLRTNTKKECSHPFSKNCVFGGLLGFRSNAGPSGSCPDLQFQRMFGPLQARPSCLCEHLSQALRPYGCSLPCATFRIAPHETISLMDKIVEDPLHRTSHSPNQGVTQLLSHPLNMEKPHFSLEWSQNGCDSLSPHGYDGCIIDWLGRGLQRQTSARCFDRRVPLLVHKQPGAQSRLPGTDSLSPPSQRVSCDSQDGQHGGGIPHKSPKGFTVAHPEQACALASPLVSEQVPLPESSLRSGSFEPAVDFLLRQKLRPGEWMLNRQTVVQIWDLFGEVEVNLFATQESSQCPLWFSLSSPAPLSIEAFAHPWPNVRLYAFPPVKLNPAVLCRVKKSGVRLLLIALFWPFQTWFSELILLLYRSPWEIPIRQDLLSQLQDLASSAWDLEAVGMAHPRQPTLISSLPDYH